MNKGGGAMVCKCPHHKMVPLLVTLFGLDFLLHSLGWWVSDSFLAVSWPVLVTLAGFMKLSKGMCKCC